MKQLLWTAAFLGASLASAAAQDHSYVFVANTGSTVDVRRPNGTLVTTLSGAPYNFNAPYDIVAVPSRDLVVVSNNGNSQLTVIDARTFAFLLTINLGALGLDGLNLRGMSLSGDEGELFVAGQRNLGATVVPAVYRVLLADMTATLAGQMGAAGDFAEDCVVVNASAVGGSGGAAAGRVYFSVPTGNFLGVMNIDPPAPGGSIPFGAGALANVTTPTQLERTPDHAAVFAGCSSNDVPLNRQFIARIQTGGDLPTQHVLRTGAIQNLGQVLDIAFRPDGRAYVIGSQDSSPAEIIEMDAAGNNLGVAPQLANVTTAGRIRYDGNPPRLYVGEAGGTSADYAIRYATVQPTLQHRLQSASVGGPRAFAFLASSSPLKISAVWPPGRVAGTGTIDVLGSGFDATAVVTFIGNSTLTRIVRTVDPASRTSSLLRVDSTGLAQEAYDIEVANPNGDTFTLDRYFVSLNPATPLTPSLVDAPARTEGYSLVSVPQYLSAGDLLAAINAQFGGYSPSNVRVFLQNGGSYLELNAAPSNFDLSNSSFWILSRSGGSLTLNQTPVGAGLQGAGEDDKIMILEPGWNLIAQPTFNPSGGGRYNMNSVGAYADGGLTVPALGGTSSLIDTAAAGLTSLPAHFVNGAYVFLTAADDMFTGTGYWLRNNTGAPLYLEFLTSDATAKGIGGRSAPRAAGATGDTPPAPPSAPLSDEGRGSGCGLLGLELLALLAFRRARGRRKVAP